MKMKNIRDFLDATTQDDRKYVAKRAGITHDYLVYHIAAGRRPPTKDTAEKLERASISLSKRKPSIPVLRCTDFIDSYERCPHKVDLP